jgi:RNA polymerase sigma-70 factor (ECF subfamily)
MAVPLIELWFGAGDSDTASSAPSRDAAGFRGHTTTEMDEALVRRLRADDGTAYTDAIRAYYEWLYDVARRFVGSDVVAEEIVDGAFERVWERRSSLAPDTTLAVLLFVAVRNAALNTVKHDAVVERGLRLMASTETTPGMGMPPERADLMVEHEELIASVWRAIDGLRDPARAILTLRWREQLEWPAIAAALGMSLAAVQMQHSRALKALRLNLPQYFGPSS